ncbi:hypothetical protein [Sinosporangium siamense]|uniref:Uncharacterized protein n=1 Tax=Sinosporangium siamense TaxID=1367973 RepID=A0A919V584_9ACTN|nr:hypothetical protein [Sinosporangium siamense]GII91293.1 hypothetical protein Ssi02_15240 [Sinosporangium siamense]
MRDRRGVSREELKQSAATTVAVLLVLGLATAWSVLIPGVNAWDNIVAAVIGSLRLTGPVATAFAAWVAVRRRRAVRKRRPTTWQALKAPLAILVVVAGSFGATIAVLAAQSALTEQAGRLLPGGLAMGMAGLALYAAIGWVAGWALPWIATPIAAGVGCYGLFTWLADGSSWADRFAPATREPYDVFGGLGGTAFADQTVWLLGVSAVLLLGWAAVVTRRPLAFTAAGLAVIAAGVGMARLASAPGPSAGSPVAYACQRWPITVCVHPGMRTGLTDLNAAFTKVASRLAGTPAAFTRVEQRPRGGRPATLSPGMVQIHVDDLAAGFADEATAEFVETLAKSCPASPAGGYREIVTAWLKNEPLPAGPLLEHQNAAAWFSGLTDFQRRDWLRLFYADFSTCRLTGAHFAGGQMAQADPWHGTPRQSYPVNPTPGGSPPAVPLPSLSYPVRHAPAGPLGTPPGPPGLQGRGAPGRTP